MKKRIIIISSLIILSIVIVGIYSTFATDEASISNNTYDFILSGNNGEITVPAGSSKTVIYKVTNTNRGKVRYGIAYLGENISVKVYEDSSDDITGYIDYGETKFIKLYIENSSDSDSTVTIKTALGYEDGGELVGTPAVPSGYVLVSEVYVPTKGVTLVDYLTNKYMSASPEQATVANNGINYYYAPSVSMMNDGMGSNHVWEDGTNTGNIRYYGATPNNYIDIGDRDASGNVVLWRIIGVFKNMKLADGTTDTLVKVVRSEILDHMLWDDDSNDWHSATLQEYLNNGEYYTNLSQTVKDNLAKVKWNLGGYEDSSIYSNDIYKYERENLKYEENTYETIWEGNVALVYPSDYGYGADLTKCSQVLDDYSEDWDGCIKIDWLYTGDNRWFLTPGSDYYNSAWGFGEDGNPGGRMITYYNEFGIFPSLYLKSDLLYDTGYGTEDNPYKLKVEEKEETFVEYLTNKYMSANPTQATVANNGINYYYAPSVNMMNDGMGSNHVWEDGTNTGNIRYYGATPANYIDIGDRDSSGNVIPWRIIGVFKNMKLADGTTDTLVKVIRDESIGTMFWNEEVNNDWSSATLQTYLNKGEYYTGLLQSVKDNIASVEWSLLGNTDEIIYSNDMYGYERGSLTSEDYGYIYDSSWYGKIALMYPSDYSYATDLTKCSKKLIDYGTDINCTEKNWLYKNNYQWLITPHASDSTYPHAWITFNEGGLGEGVVHLIEDSHVYPSLYLKSNLIYDTGDGSSVENAYVVK